MRVAIGRQLLFHVHGHYAQHVVHAVDDRQLRVWSRGLQLLRVRHADLDVVAALQDQRRNPQPAEGLRRVLAEQGDQVGLYAGPKQHFQRFRHLGHLLAGPQAGQ
ncbi:hypothetical protein D9M73_266370 [compost metagenome]